MRKVKVNSYLAFAIVAIVGTGAAFLIINTANQAYAYGNEYSASLQNAYTGVQATSTVHTLK